MIRFHYEYKTVSGAEGRFHVDEHSESIANCEAKMTLERRVQPHTLTAFNLVARERAPT